MLGEGSLPTNIESDETVRLYLLLRSVGEQAAACSPFWNNAHRRYV